jgi:hypothetical protein
MFVTNGALSLRGEVNDQMREIGYDPGYMRPYFNEKGIPCVDLRTGNQVPYKDDKGAVVTNSVGDPVTYYETEQVRVSDIMASGRPMSPVMNATTLRKDEWILLDNVVRQAARKRLKAWSDLAAANTFGGFDGMANPILEWEKVSDPGSAVQDMDGMGEAPNFNPVFSLQGLPLPITHADFFLPERFLAASRNKGIPADTSRIAFAGRRVGELVEQVTIGAVAGAQYGDSTNYGDTSKVYGYLNHPDRLTKTNMTQPDGTNGPAVLTSWLAAIESLSDANQYGPFMVYVSKDQQKYLNNLFSTTEPSAGTLRSKLLEIEEVKGIQQLDYLTAADNPYTTIFVQMDPETARAINGMDITTMQWTSMGGLRNNFKVMSIYVPQIRSDYNGNMGLLVGTVS